MEELNNREYYLTRAESCRRLAEQAVDARIGAIHVELAHRYDALIEKASAGQPSGV